MRVAEAKKRPSDQGKMWDWIGDRVLSSYPMTRPYIGDFFEEATCSLLDAQRLKTDSSADICPDLYVPSEGVYLESKAVGRSNTSILYEHRIAKYDRFLREGHRLYYVFWRHKYRWLGGEGTTLFKLREDLARSVFAAIIVSAYTVHKAAMACALKNTSYSGGHKTPLNYIMMPARTLKRTWLRKWTTGKSWGTMFVTAYGCNLNGLEVYGKIRRTVK